MDELLKKRHATTLLFKNKGKGKLVLKNQCLSAMCVNETEEVGVFVRVCGCELSGLSLLTCSTQFSALYLIDVYR